MNPTDAQCISNVRSTCALLGYLSFSFSFGTIKMHPFLGSYFDVLLLLLISALCWACHKGAPEIILRKK